MRTSQFLIQATKDLNQPDLPFLVEQDGKRLIATWKWMDGTFFGPGSVTKETKEFCYVIWPEENGTYRDMDTEVESYQGVTAGERGPLKFKWGSTALIGRSYHYNRTIALGADKDGVGVKSYHLDSRMIHDHLRTYMEQHGYRRAGMINGWIPAQTKVTLAAVAMGFMAAGLAAGFMVLWTVLSGSVQMPAITLISALMPLLIGVGGLIAFIRLRDYWYALKPMGLFTALITAVWMIFLLKGNREVMPVVVVFGCTTLVTLLSKYKGDQ